MSEHFDFTPDDAFDCPPYVIVDQYATRTAIVKTVLLDGEFVQFEAPHRVIEEVNRSVEFYNIIRKAT